MILTEEVTNNRDNLIMAIALVEDIYRTNNRIYELLRGLMNNPEEITNVKTSINDLHRKITNLKNSDIGIPLIEEEKVIFPSPPQNMPPKVATDYKKPIQQTPPKPEPKPVVEAEEIVEKPPRKIQKPRRNSRENMPNEKMMRENVRGEGIQRQPRKPLRERKTPTDLQD